MEIRNYLLNQKGQVLIESLFLAFLLASILIVFSKLIEFQKNKSSFNYSNFQKISLSAAYAQ